MEDETHSPMFQLLKKPHYKKMCNRYFLKLTSQQKNNNQLHGEDVVSLRCSCELTFTRKIHWVKEIFMH